MSLLITILPASQFKSLANCPVLVEAYRFEVMAGTFFCCIGGASNDLQ